MKLQNSSSNFSVYSTNGEQLTGDLSGYNELAHQIDKNRISFYFKASDKEILLGTRLIVQIIGGREERAIFLKKYSLSEFSYIKDNIHSFYDEARTHVEQLPGIKYRVLGLVNEGDLPVQESNITLSTISAITGKVLIREPVKIKTDNLSVSFGIMRKIIESFIPKNILNYSIAIAHYHVEADILISPTVTGMDLEILNNGQEKTQPNFEGKQRCFQAISEIYDQQRASLKLTDLRDRNKLSQILKKRLLDSDILYGIIETNPKETQNILDLYRNDTDSLYQIITRIFKYHKTLDGVNKEIVALVINHIIKSIKNPGPDDTNILKIGYYQGNDDLKNTIRQYLISEGIFEDYFLKDLIEISIKTGNIQLLKSIVKSRKCTDQEFQILKNSVNIRNFDQNQVLKFIEILFESNFEKEPDGKGDQIYQEIIAQYQNEQFNTKKLNQLQDRYGRRRIPMTPQTKIDWIKIIKYLLFIIVIIELILLIFIILSHFGLFPFPFASNPKISTETLHEIPLVQNSSNNLVLSTGSANSSCITCGGNQTNQQTVNASITMNNTPLVISINNNTNGTVQNTSLNTSTSSNNISGKSGNIT